VTFTQMPVLSLWVCLHS